VKSCSMNDFMQELAPWLDNDYIREVRKDDNGHIVLLFQDGVKDVYHIDDCTEGQIDKIFKDLKDRGITVL
jgi:hypothetical protein